MLLLTFKVRLGVITLADKLRVFGSIVSIPVDFFRFNMERKLFTKVSFAGAIRNSVLIRIFDSTYSLKISME